MTIMWCFLFICFSITASRPQQRPLTLWGHDLYDKRALLGDNPKYINHDKYDGIEGYPVRLSLSPAELTTPNGIQMIQMSWNNATTALSGDWIGIYSPTDSDDDEWLDWFYTDGTASGEYQDHIWNMRDDYELRYFLNNNGVYTLLGKSNTAKVNPNQPLQGHISITENSPYEMQVRWVSALVTNPTVQIGTESNKYTQTYNASYYTYDTTNMCGSRASTISPTTFRDPGYFYTVIVKGLEPNTKYFYKFGNAEYWSDEQSFVTSSVSNYNETNDDGFEFIMYGDQWISYTAFELATLIENEVEKGNVRLILHIGDLGYAEGIGYIWEEWSNMIAQSASIVPYMISIGNHEYCHTSPVNNKHSNGLDVSGVGGTGYHPPWGNQGDDSNGECGAPTYYRFDAPFGNNANSIFWYSFNYNMVHFTVLSSEHDYSANADGFKWLSNDLKQAFDLKNKKQISWIVVNIHRSLYESEVYPGDNEESVHLVMELEPTLKEYGVDLVLSGHFHAYERTCSVYNYTCVGRENGGITHMTIGTAGAILDNALYEPQEWSVFRDERDYGFGKFFVNSTTLIGQFVANQGGVIDEVILTK